MNWPESFKVLGMIGLFFTSGIIYLNLLLFLDCIPNRSGNWFHMIYGIVIMIVCCWLIIRRNNDKKTHNCM